MKHLQINIEKYEVDWKEILKDISFTLNARDKIALVWQNGVWKTTLLKILTWEIKEYTGNIDNIWNLSLWYLAQMNIDDTEKTVYQELKDSFWQIIQMEKELSIYEEKIKTDHSSTTLELYTSLLDQFHNIWWYDYEKEIHGVANGMNILDLLDKKLVEISGWQRTKIALAKILLLKPDILFLDEPTNFIDLTSVEWLENYLTTKWIWGYVIISHDREFLDITCPKTFELQPLRQVNFYHVPYSQYVEERERKEKKLQEEYERQVEWIHDQEWLINRFRAWSRAWWAKSREKMLDRLDKVEPPYIPRKPKFQFLDALESGEKILTFKEAFIWRKEPLFYISDITLFKWMKVWIVWENGVWKSTLLKTILWEIELLDGYMSMGKWLEIAYYSQLHEELDKSKTIKENFEKFGFHYPDNHLASILAHSLFTYEDVHKKVSDLSGWQTTRLHFAILWQKETNFLILDEPTNHLDYDSREALEFALKNYKWTVLFISHDRYFVNKISTHIWFVREWELSLSYGNYEDYRLKI